MAIKRKDKLDLSAVLPYMKTILEGAKRVAQQIRETARGEFGPRVRMFHIPSLEHSMSRLGK